MLVSCFGKFGDGAEQDTSASVVVVSIEALAGRPLGTFRFSQAEVARLVGLLGNNGLPLFGQTLRESISSALDTSRTSPRYKENVWPELFTWPLHVLVHPDEGEAVVLQEYLPGADSIPASASFARWLQGKSPLLRVAPVAQGADLMRT
jgi:hypothetical protein